MSSLKPRPCKQSSLLHTDFIRQPMSTLTISISFFYVALVESDLLCLWKLWNPTGEGSLSTMAVCQVQLVLIHSVEKLHYQLERSVSLAGGGLGRWLASCYDQRALRGTLHLCPALFFYSCLRRWPLHSSKTLFYYCTLVSICSVRWLCSIRISFLIAKLFRSHVLFQWEQIVKV